MQISFILQWHGYLIAISPLTVLLSEVSEEIPSHLRCIILQSAGVAGAQVGHFERKLYLDCLLYTSPSPRD